MNELLTVKEAADRLGTAERFIRRLIFERRISYTNTPSSAGTCGSRPATWTPSSARVESRPGRPYCRRAVVPSDATHREAHPQGPGDLPGSLPRSRRAGEGSGLQPPGGCPALLDRVENSKLRGTWTDPALGRVLFRDWLAEWWSTTTNLRPSTQARDEMLLRRYALPRFGNQPLAAIRQREVRAWVADLAATELAPSTVRKTYHLLGKVLAAAVDAGMIAQSPCQRVPLPKIEREEMRFLTPAEIARLADAIRPRYRALVLVGAYGGLRIGELAGLRRSRVDLLRGTVEVAEIITEVGGRLRMGPPKTRASRRTVGLPRGVVAELAAHLTTPAPPDAFVFTAPKGGPLRVIAFRARTWRPATRSAGVDGLRIHDLRHTAVALWIAAGANPKEVAARAGHTSVSFTLDRYGHLYPESDAALRDRLDTIYTAGQRDQGAGVVELFRERSRPQRSPGTRRAPPAVDR